MGLIYWYTLASTNPQYDLMELKSLEDWVLEKEFKSVPGVVNVSSFGGLTREYQVQVDPNKLVGSLLPPKASDAAVLSIYAAGSPHSTPMATSCASPMETYGLIRQGIGRIEFSAPLGGSASIY